MMSHSSMQSCQPLPSDSLVIDPASVAYLQGMLDRGIKSGKVVVARKADKVVVAVGSTDLFHVDIIERATQSLFSESWVTSTAPDKARPIAGALIQGAIFTLENGGRTLEIMGQSLSFGPLRDGIFMDPTREVLTRLLSGHALRNAAA